MLFLLAAIMLSTGLSMLFPAPYDSYINNWNMTGFILTAVSQVRLNVKSPWAYIAGPGMIIFGWLVFFYQRKTNQTHKYDDTI